MKTISKPLHCSSGDKEWVEDFDYIVTEQRYRGQLVEVQCFADDHWPSCLDNEHDLAVMHHYDDDGKHYCPTGILLCSTCTGLAKEPEPHACVLWGEAKPGLTDFVCDKHRPAFEAARHSTPGPSAKRE